MTDTLATVAKPAKPSPYHEAEVLWVKHWTDQLFSFGLSRAEDFRFRSGEFVMIGLPTETGKPLVRAYSVASPFWAEELEFFSIKVADGPLTSRLQKIQPGDTVLVGKKPTGTLVLDALTGGERLHLIGTGTGLAPWLSVAREPETYSRFGRVIVTREPFHNAGRITDRIRSGDYFRDLGLEEGFDPAKDRVMLCGSMAMIKETAELLEDYGMREGSNAEPGDFVLERAFVG